MESKDNKQGAFNNWNTRRGDKGGMSMSTVLHGKMYFNDEDLLYLNRVAFYMLCEVGPDLTFSEFIEKLKIMQDGSFL